MPPVKNNAQQNELVEGVTIRMKETHNGQILSLLGERVATVISTENFDSFRMMKTLSCSKRRV